MTDAQKDDGAAAPRKRILIIDDELFVTETVVRILQEGGFDAWGVNDPGRAPGRAAELRPDLLILDFDLGKVSGPDVAMILRSDSRLRNIPIIYLSGMIDEDHRVIGAASGAAAYLDKPVEGAKLIETILALLARRMPSQGRHSRLP